jgi:hypothetical protein
MEGTGKMNHSRKLVDRVGRQLSTMDSAVAARELRPPGCLYLWWVKIADGEEALDPCPGGRPGT